MKKVIIASVIALALAVSASANSAQAYSFANYLRVGSTGADVSALQSWLVANNYLSMPAGVSMGYFGQLTKAAVVRYQASVGLPATGFVGPLTVAKLNGNGGGTATLPPAAGCPAGYTCTPTTLPGTISTSGMEGTLSADNGAVSNTTVYENQANVPVLNVRLRATGSDINVQRVTVNLGTSANAYTRAFSSLSVMGDDGKVLSTTPLNSLNVTKAGSYYYTNLIGFSYKVPVNSYRYLTVVANVYPAVNSTYQTSYTFAVPANGVRGVDGAGIDVYAGGNSATDVTTIGQSITISASLADSATLSLSTNSATPQASSVIANTGSNSDQADKVTVLVFDLKATKDAIGVTDILASTTMSGVGKSASTTSAYLYDGSNLLASAAVASNGTISFTNINGVGGVVVPKDTTKSFTIKLDYRQALSSAEISTTTVRANGISAVNSIGSSISASSVTGSASSNSLSVQKAGPIFTLLSKSISKAQVASNTTAGTSSVSVDALFRVRVAAVGTSVVIGTAASSTSFASTTVVSAANTGSTFTIYRNGVDQSTSTITLANGSERVSTITVSFTTPDTGVTTDTTNNTLTIADGATADFDIHAKFAYTGGVATNDYAVQMKKLFWNGTTSTWMDGLSAWRTDAVVLP